MAQSTNPANSTATPDREVAQRSIGLDYELLLDCVHCGLCTSACPTYVELGNENDSPRGRIYLMRALMDGRIEYSAEVERHLDLCLDCRACETACPSGVQYGNLIEPFRIHMASKKAAPALSPLTRLLLFHVTPYAGRMRMALWPARWMQRLGVDRLLQRIGLLQLAPRVLRQAQAMLPRLHKRPRFPEVLPAEGTRRARVGLFLGCAGDAFFPKTTLATARVLQHNGCEVWIPRTQSCCGALHYHAGRANPAKVFARQNCAAFAWGLLGDTDQLDAIITNAAGCGALLKDYHHLLGDSPECDLAARFKSKVRDVSEFLMELGPIKPSHPLKMKATYHDACHLLHAQKIAQPPRQLLSMIPGLELIPLPETELCCGAAGSYNLTEPEMSERLGKRKVQNILNTGADAVFTANVGCQLQIGRYLRELGSTMIVAHPIDALWASYSGTDLH